MNDATDNTTPSNDNVQRNFDARDQLDFQHWDVIQDVPLKAANDNGMF